MPTTHKRHTNAHGHAANAKSYKHTQTYLVRFPFKSPVLKLIGLSSGSPGPAFDADLGEGGSPLPKAPSGASEAAGSLTDVAVELLAHLIVQLHLVRGHLDPANEQRTVRLLPRARQLEVGCERHATRHRTQQRGP